MRGPSSVAIIGGGLAGLAAAVAAVERGLHVELFEQASHLGGRAGSFVDSKTGDRIDYCQHVAMGCCTAFRDFCRRTQIDDCFRRCDTLHFIGPDGTCHDFAPSRWLPRPLHLLPGLWKLKYLTPSERLGIILAMRKLTLTPHAPREAVPHGSHGNQDTVHTIGAWLRQQGQSERAIEQFWSVVLVSALGETVDRASLAAARKVFCDGFLASRAASDLVLPRLPLGAIFHDRLGAWLADHGVVVHLRTPVQRIEGDGRKFRTILLGDGTRREFDSAVVAVPWHGVKRLLAEDLAAAMPALANVDRIERAAITAVHLWFDRPIAPLPHAVLVGRLGQWVFTEATSPSYCQVVISATHRLPNRSHREWVSAICSELQAIWPGSRLLHSRVVTQPAAVFSMQPETDSFRPAQQTPIENIFLASDWTATGWPATMEGAIRSGEQAVESIGASRGA